MRIDDALNFAKAQLPNSDSALLDAQVLLAFVLDKETVYLMTWPERTLTDAQLAKFKDLITKRSLGHPVAHLTGTREFWSLDLKVNNSTLIPRPDTEILVEYALENSKPDAKILDLGTGSGAIILAIASELPNTKCIGVDLSVDAIALANENLSSLQLKNVSFKQSDWFSNIDLSFDLIVSNPPYIDPTDHHLDEGDVRFEPRSALVSDDCGLADIKLIARQSHTYLNRFGTLIIEHGFDQGTAVQEILTASGFTGVCTKKDLSGNDRITIGIKIN